MVDKRKQRITASLRPELVRLLAMQAELRQMDKSAIVEEALADWLERQEQEDRGATLRGELLGEIRKLSEQLHRSTERLQERHTNTRRSVEMVYSLIELAFKEVTGDVTRHKTRGRAIENMRNDQKQADQERQERAQQQARQEAQQEAERQQHAEQQQQTDPDLDEHGFFLDPPERNERRQEDSREEARP